MLSGAATAVGGMSAEPQQTSPADAERDTPDKFLLNEYRPESIYKIPKTEIQRAKFPIIDAHCHGIRPPREAAGMVKLMDAVGVERTVIFTGAATPERFGEVRRIYAAYRDRFDLWCSFDLTGVDQPGFGPNAVKRWTNAMAWARWGWGKSATRAGVSSHRARLPRDRIPTTREWNPSGTGAGNWQCP